SERSERLEPLVRQRGKAGFVDEYPTVAEPEKTIKPEIGDRFTPVHGASAPAWAKFEREPARTTRRTLVLRKTCRVVIEAPEDKTTFILCKCQKRNDA
ncbi:hypothetical protein, partial [Stutzerimonas stutzeri]|uniref:hypothetical protein n=1 Tax=Stutzerimonas stutzeri TaxID=316 RepID=UPI00210A50B9